MNTPKHPTPPNFTSLKSYPPECSEVLSFLNQMTGSNFRNIEVHLSQINARIKEGGVDVDGIKKMIARQCERWGKDPKMAEYLRPKTLFGKKNFDNYYAAKDLPAYPKPSVPKNNQAVYNVPLAEAQMRW